MNQIMHKKRDGIIGNISDSKPDAPGSSPGHSAIPLSFFSARPFGGKPQPLKETKIWKP